MPGCRSERGQRKEVVGWWEEGGEDEGPGWRAWGGLGGEESDTDAGSLSCFSLRMA